MLTTLTTLINIGLMYRVCWAQILRHNAISTVVDPEGGAAGAPPPRFWSQNKKTTIFRPKYGQECVI